MPRPFLRPVQPLLLLLLISGGCSRDTVVVARDTQGMVEPPVVDGGKAGPDSSMQTDAKVPIDAGDTLVLCGGAPCACNDGLDNDEDGHIDGYDPECTGPFDDDEETFGTGLPSGGRSKCRDCFFDGNGSTVDDGCNYHRDCLLGLEPGAGERCGCDVSAECVNTCRTRTPNGCDCFGCCHVLDASGALYSVELSEGCSQDNLDDEKKCTPCDRDETCVNPCGACELCPGRGPAQLPTSCAKAGDDAPPFECNDGRVCDDQHPCLDRFYCLQGCCIPILF